MGHAVTLIEGYTMHHYPPDASLSIVIPVYNSAEILPELVYQLAALLPSIAADHEIILIDDGSRDDSWNVMQLLAKEYPAVRSFTLMRNYGQHNALLCGIRAATKQIIVTMDDDLQHPPEEIPLLLAKLAEGYDVVYGTPRKEQHGFWRDLASQVTKMALKEAMGADTAQRASAFRAFRCRVRDAFADYRSPYVCIDVLLTWGTTRFSYVYVRHEPRNAGVSNYTFRKLLAHALTMMTGFSVLPLQVASVTGFAFALFGLIILGYVVVRYILEGGSAPGFPFLASIISIFSGAQLLAIGIIGEYLARMHFRMMERPSYVVQQDIQSNSKVIDE